MNSTAFIQQIGVSVNSLPTPLITGNIHTLYTTLDSDQEQCVDHTKSFFVQELNQGIAQPPRQPCQIVRIVKKAIISST